MVGTALGQLPAGFLSDRYGRLPVLYVGVVTFTVASIATSLSNHIEIVLAARFFQGFGASVGVVITRAIVRDVASGKQMARLMSAMVMIFTATPIFAPIIGSYLTTLYGWRMPYVAMAVIGIAMLFSIRIVLRETHVPTREHHIVRQLGMSLKEFFSHRQSVFGVLLRYDTAEHSGFVSIITTSAALIIEVFGVSGAVLRLYICHVQVIGILAGSTLNRRLLHRYSTLADDGCRCRGRRHSGCTTFINRMAGTGAVSGGSGATPAFFMVGTGFLLPNATSLALDPVPKIAGTASSLVTALQNLAGSSRLICGSAIIYDGSISRASSSSLDSPAPGPQSCFSFFARQFSATSRYMFPTTNRKVGRLINTPCFGWRC